MNREIRFRAWDTKNGMVYNPAFQVPEKGQVGLDDLCKIAPNLMQYTGLKDKNGKEIYEGDVVNNKSLSMKGEIKIGSYENSLGKYYGWYIHRYMKIGKDKATTWESPHWGIIGNIYENPELVNNNEA